MSNRALSARGAACALAAALSVLAGSCVSRPSPTPTTGGPRPLADPQLYWQLPGPDGRLYFCVVSRRTALGYLYLYETGVGLRTMDTEPTLWGHPSVGDAGRALVAARAGARGDTEVVLWRLDGPAVVSHGSALHGLQISPDGACVAFIEARSDGSVAPGCLRHAAGREGWKRTYWDWEGSGPSELVWTPAGDLLAVALDGTAMTFPYAVYLVDPESAERHTLFASDGHQPVFWPLSQERPHQILMVTASAQQQADGRATVQLVDAAAKRVSPLVTGPLGELCVPSPSGAWVALTQRAVAPTRPNRPDDPYAPTGPSRVIAVNVEKRSAVELTAGDYADTPAWWIGEREVVYARMLDGRTALRCCGVDGGRDREIVPALDGWFVTAGLAGGDHLYFLHTARGLALYRVAVGDSQAHLVHEWP